MKINKNIKSLLNLSIFLSKYLWIYFVFLAIAALFPLSNYISSATQATLLIICFPLLIIRNLLAERQYHQMAEDEKIRFLKNNITFPFKITFTNSPFYFEKVVSIKQEEWIKGDDLTFEIAYQEKGLLVIDFYRKEIDMVIRVKYLEQLPILKKI
jgi:hypothetical protein